jgi:hypothetical protein
VSKDADLIHSYSRADTLRDGVLIDVTPAAGRRPSAGRRR